MRLRLLTGFLGPLLLLASAGAQDEYIQSRYDAMYGAPVEILLEDLVRMGSAYDGKAVKTKGILEMRPVQSRRLWLIGDHMGNRVEIAPVRDVADAWDYDGLKMTGGEVQVTGVFSAQGGSVPLQQPIAGTGEGGIIQFWKYVGPPEESAKTISKAESLTLEALVSRAARLEGQTVRVEGQFRGRNLFGDLPAKSERGGSDWVIKDDLYAVWVTGKKPKGSGWALDSGLKRDTGKWIEVVGRVETHAGVVYLQALQVMLGSPPKPEAQAQPPAPPAERPKVPPVVVFALPLDGDPDVPAHSRFSVQFSKDMDESTFKGRVVLRYTGRPIPGDRDLDGVTMSYDEGRHAITVDPGDLLRPGRQIELLLLPGILDVDGLGLQPRPGHEVGVAVDVLRYRISGG
jgi:hypothetical protein